MAVAVPKRRTAPAPPPARTAPPKRKAPARKPASAARAAAAAPARAPARRAPARRAPARKAPARKGQPTLALVGRTAVAVGQLPDSGLIVRLTRGRAWIGLLGVLLVGIVALNVVTLSFAASAGKIDQNISALEKENSLLANREAMKFGTKRIRGEAAALGLIMPNTEEPQVLDPSPGDVETAAARLAAAGG
jgi:hypothetical protein